MTLRTAVASGNFSDPSIWDTGVPGVGDVAECAGFTVVIDVDIVCDQLQSSGAGYFSVVSAPRSITANVRSNTGHTGGGVVRCSHTTGTVTIVGNVQAGPSRGVDNDNAGALTINGTVVGGNAIYAYGVRNTSTGTVAIAAVTGGSSESHGIYNSGTGTVTIGTCIGGSGSNTYGAYNGNTGTIIITTCTGGPGNNTHGVRNISSGTVMITTCTGGSGIFSKGAVNSGAGTIIIETAIGGTGAESYGVFNEGAGRVTVTRAVGNDYGPGSAHSNANVGVYGTRTAGQITEVYQVEYGTYGQSPTGGSVTLVDSENNQAQFQVVLGGTTKTLIGSQPADFPATKDVRWGVTYNEGVFTGTLAVPAANQVAVGVAVDDGVGTAVLTAESAATAIWDALRADHNTPNTFGAVSEWTRLVSDQNIRDAMKLAPSAGDPADGSIDKHLDLAALEDTLSAIKGSGWATETLKEIYDLIKTRAAPGDAMSFTMNAASVAIALSEQVIQIYRGDVLSMVITPPISRNISGRTKAWFVIKNDKNDSDSDSWIFIEETAGLTIAFGKPYPTPTDGSIEVTDANSGAFKLTLKAPVTQLMTRGKRYWDFQVLESDGPHTIATGTCTVTLDVARVIT